MPILADEPRIYPEGLFEQDKENPAARAWWVLHTRPRQEKSLARQLHAGAIPFYLPLITKRQRLHNRTLTSHLPLFPGYLFVLAEYDQRLAALATKRVVRALKVPDQKGLWRDLSQVNRLIQIGAPIMPEERLEPGDLVEIRSGPLAGLKGTVVEKASRRRFVVAVDFIHRGASITFDDYTLAPVND